MNKRNFARTDFLGRFRGVFFDLDGTVLDSVGMAFDGFVFAIKSVTQQDASVERITSFFGAGEDKIFERMLGLEQGKAAYQVFLEYNRMNISRLRLHEGVREVIERFREHDVPLAVVTGRSRRTAEMLLQHHGLLDHFATIVTDSDISESKPSPEGIRLACDTIGVSPEEVLFAGDSPMDMQAACGAGAAGIAVTWDSHCDLEKLKASKPCFWAERASEVWDIWVREMRALPRNTHGERSRASWLDHSCSSR